MIETERLLLREYTMDDFDALYGTTGTDPVVLQQIVCITEVAKKQLMIY
ncbi:MAG: hypothetical protein K5656_10110 [Lachnospiraceae bacterium]|nr:hypothetical protein [Lachnospiraceae bacterium]